MKAVDAQSVQTKSTQKDSSNQSNSEEAKSVHEELVADIERLNVCKLGPSNSPTKHSQSVNGGNAKQKTYKFYLSAAE